LKPGDIPLLCWFTRNPFGFTEAKADVNARDQNNMTPLMGCIVGGEQALNKML